MLNKHFFLTFVFLVVIIPCNKLIKKYVYDITPFSNASKLRPNSNTTLLSMTNDSCQEILYFLVNSNELKKLIYSTLRDAMGTYTSKGMKGINDLIKEQGENYDPSALSAQIEKHLHKIKETILKEKKKDINKKMDKLKKLVKSHTTKTDESHVQIEDKTKEDLPPPPKQFDGIGGCTSESDVSIIYGNFQKKTTDPNGLSPSNNFYKILLKCSSDNYGSGDSTMKCVEDELKEKNLKLSDTCSDCFKRSVECGKSKCWFKCIFGSPCSSSCYSCATSNCDADFLRCSGLTNVPPACI
ncbi:conserved protein, unknown function [Hepatocystis sp. ex Piliocolobus tephrosceles]|nr:conserved protein, unknown function [Hepatocystis sp. ex Piliocolobus tephrosceles]